MGRALLTPAAVAPMITKVSQSSHVAMKKSRRLKMRFFHHAPFGLNESARRVGSAKRSRWLWYSFVCVGRDVVVASMT